MAQLISTDTFRYFSYSNYLAIRSAWLDFLMCCSARAWPLHGNKVKIWLFCWNGHLQQRLLLLYTSEENEMPCGTKQYQYWRSESRSINVMISLTKLLRRSPWRPLISIICIKEIHRVQGEAKRETFNIPLFSAFGCDSPKWWVWC